MKKYFVLLCALIAAFSISASDDSVEVAGNRILDAVAPLAVRYFLEREGFKPEPRTSIWCCPCRTLSWMWRNHYMTYTLDYYSGICIGLPSEADRRDQTDFEAYVAGVVEQARKDVAPYLWEIPEGSIERDGVSKTWGELYREANERSRKCWIDFDPEKRR